MVKYILYSAQITKQVWIIYCDDETAVWLEMDEHVKFDAANRSADYVSVTSPEKIGCNLPRKSQCMTVDSGKG
jgi:hypothetical protein